MVEPQLDAWEGGGAGRVNSGDHSHGDVSDGELWRLAGCTRKGEWATGNTRQKKVAAPEVQASGTDPYCASMDKWPQVPDLKTQLHRKEEDKE
ncbi:Telomerase protein component 1 [Heterocephalus glaber]|uniref:Telomerase protein component 1 n=1 Tax=Heterocephalus glaber TaxID=10181 RepID=G5B0T7_HETGA|nr:Telomerase protein component 1 [Heterocephalus glaber]